ncbi:zinc finger protein 518A [Cynoglossus semilaevis]|uniref:zinc finger protein 518A n=1 Tax=Cynoglossus semilaevis TaxID=244447 RepID=UPI00049528C2|nr:zinc finger protein 518A-like [Cynoglossus semilaevis]
MEEDDLVIPHDSTKHCSLSVLENEKVTDFVYKNFTDVTDESLFCHGEESSNKDRESSPQKTRQTLGKGHCKIQQQGAFFTGKILSFGCLVCKDEFTYSPNDLLKHFQVAHEGTLPTYPCDLCGFVTHEFSALQRHRIEHKNTLVTCELCNDGVQYSLLLVTRHYMMRHSQNGHFKCDWCDFTTKDAGTFVQHLHHHNENHWRCLKCRHISLSEDDHQKHIKAHSGVFPFRCLVCGFGAVRNEDLKKHMAAVHKQMVERRPLKTFEDGGLSTSSALKLMLKKSGHFQDTQKISNSNCLPGILPNQNGRLVHEEQFVEEYQHSVDGTVSKNNGSHISDQSTSVMLQDADVSASSDAVNHKNPNGLTVLMLKNKISIPPNCTTKVMGFKMVDGKKHLVLKVIQSGKSDSKVSAEELSPSTDHSNDSIENGDCLDHRSSTPPSKKPHFCSPMDPDDIVAVKVKMEEEETAVCNLDVASIHSTEGQNDHWHKMSSNGSDSMTNDNIVHHVHLSQTVRSEKSRFDDSDPVPHNAGTTSLCSDSEVGVVEETEVSKSVLTLTDADSENHRSFSFHNYHQVCHSSPESTYELSFKSKDRNGEQNSTEPSSFNPALLRERVVSSENLTQSSANQDVFTFHNYSKDKCGSSLPTLLSFNKTLKPSADRESTCEVSKVSLTHTDPPEPLTQNTLEEPCQNTPDATEQESGSHDSEELSSVYDPLTEDDNFDLVLQEFNIIKVEDDCVPISKNIPETKSNVTSFGSVVEKHSEAIISQQLDTERLKCSNSSGESLKQTKTTLRILQLPDGKKPVLLRTSENRLAVPVQVKSTPGFKLLTNSAHPQINVSYLKPGVETLTSQSSVTLKPSSTLAVSSPKAGTAVKGTTLYSPVPPGISSSSSQYFINSPTGLKGPVLLSSTPQNTQKDKSVKTQPTCYLLQKSVPAVPSPSTPALRLASTPLSLNSRPVLAMPVNSADKSRTLQSGRQAFLLRYISPPKPGAVLNNQVTKAGTHQFSQSMENTSNKVIFKLVTPTSSLLQSGAPLNSQPLLLATRPQTQCFLVAPNKAHVNASNGVGKLISVQKDVKEPSQMNVKVQSCDAEKPMLAPRSIRPPSQRKRRRKALFDDEYPTTGHKVRRLSNRAASEKEAVLLWRPVAKEVERTLRLAPFSSLQQVKCPRRYQPVVVLNHPDADIPEVANIMKVVHRHRGSVSKVSLSQRTVQALAELGAPGTSCSTKVGSSQREGLRSRPVQSSVRERFLLKMMLRKKSRKKYEVVEPSGGRNCVVFDCWFCGRLFNSQEDWIGHGQRHLMEATRDWNKLF